MEKKVRDQQETIKRLEIELESYKHTLKHKSLDIKEQNKMDNEERGARNRSFGTWHRYDDEGRPWDKGKEDAGDKDNRNYEDEMIE